MWAPSDRKSKKEELYILSTMHDILFDNYPENQVKDDDIVLCCLTCYIFF